MGLRRPLLSLPFAPCPRKCPSVSRVSINERERDNAVGPALHAADGSTLQRLRGAPFPAGAPSRSCPCRIALCYSTPWCGLACRRYRSWRSGVFHRAIIRSAHVQSRPGLRTAPVRRAGPGAIRRHADRAWRSRVCPLQTHTLTFPMYSGPRPDKA